MAYVLRHYDLNIVRFDLVEDFDGTYVRLIEVDPAHARTIPLDMKSTTRAFSVRYAAERSPVTAPM